MEIEEELRDLFGSHNEITTLPKSNESSKKHLRIDSVRHSYIHLNMYYK